ncbi:hypothetical protein ABPG77_007628 [Micractinium sp. CCAP 211/92]
MAAPAEAEARGDMQLGGWRRGGLRVEELPINGSDSLGPGSGRNTSGTCTPKSEASALPRLACRIEMPDSPRGESGACSHSSGGVPYSLPAASAALAPATMSRSSSGASMAATPSTAAERSVRMPSAAESGSAGPDSQPSTLAGTAAMGDVFSGQQPVHDGPMLLAAQQQQQQPAAGADAGTPVAPPAAWAPASAASAEVQRRFAQDQAWQGLQQERLSMARQDSLMPYEIDPHDLVVGQRLALGGFAEVFAGRYQGTAVAIKLLLSVDEQGQESFRSEVHLLERLRHPNIVLFMGVCTRPYLAIVSEYMARGSLFRLLRRGDGRPLPPKLQRSVAVSVARGMAYLHSRAPPLLHLDLKSPNILLDDRWRVKIADFGLSRLKSNASGMQGTGGGTPEWMAPEVIRSEPYDERADVYSYGVVLWECLTGQQPWQGLHPMQVVAAVGFQGRQLPTKGLEGDPVLVSLCRRCMASDPGQRPTFPEILQELEVHHTARPHDSSEGSQLLDEARAATEPEDSSLVLPPLHLAAAARAQRGGKGGAEELKYGQQRYEGRDDLPFVPAEPLPAAAPAVASLPAEASGVAASPRNGRAPSQGPQEQQQLQPSPFAVGGSISQPAAAAGLLHPAYSITNDSPFAQLPAFGSGSDEDEEAGGVQHGLGSGPGSPGVIQQASRTGGPSSSSGGPTSSTSFPGSGAAQQQAAATAAHVAAKLSQQLQGCDLSGQSSGTSRLSSGSLVREPGSPLARHPDVASDRPWPPATSAASPAAGHHVS